TKFHSIVHWFLPWLRVSKLKKTIVNLSATTEIIENETMYAIRALQIEITSLSQVVLQNRRALDLLLASQGGVCKVTNSSCCMYIDHSGGISTNLN
ncbi:ERVV2 protein, partial [Furnarius figulus]|nr:ERVV2 protein [Furnarius figulus]